VNGDRRIDQIALERPQPSQRAIFVGTREPAISDNIGRQYRRDFSCVAHAGADFCSGRHPLAS
jgi:hypothetical protein